MDDPRHDAAGLLAELARLREQVKSLQEAEIEAKEDEADRSRTHRIIQDTIDSVPFEIFTIGTDGRYDLQNAIARLRWGDLRGTRPEDCRIPANRAVWLENNRRAFAGELVEGEVDLLVQGVRRHFYNIIAPIRNLDQVDGILGMNIDITERKQAEAELQRANAELRRRAELHAEELLQTNRQLQAIYEGVVDGLLVADAATTQFLRTNPSMCRMLGYTEEELLARSVKDIHPPEDVAIEIESFHARYEGQLSEVKTRPMMRKDGSIFYADIRARRIIYDGRACLIGFFRDASERIEAERARQKERQVLRNMLAASDRERQLISYEIHDGLAQQLTGALMQFQSFESLRVQQPQAAAGSYERGIELLRDSLNEARRLIAGVRPPLLDDAGVVAAIESLTEELNCRDGARIELANGLDFDRLQPVLENALYRIVQESLTNACRHSGSDHIRVGLLQEGECVVVEVRDWGAGFDPSQIQEGCFGLEGIRERARLLGGRSEIRSQPGDGTMVRVCLPMMVGESP